MKEDEIDTNQYISVGGEEGAGQGKHRIWGNIVKSDSATPETNYDYESTIHRKPII